MSIVTFYPTDHKYIDDSGRVYISVTQMLKRMFPFDQEAILEKIINNPKSVYYKRDKASIVQEWADIGTYGTALHEICELYVNTGYIEEGNMFTNCVKQFSKVIDRTKCTSEKLLWNEDLLIAGTADLIVEKDDCYEIWDVKTNKKLDDSKLLQYSMQLTFYQIFAKKFYNKPIRLGGIVYFDNFFVNRENTKMSIIKPIPCIDRVKQLLVERHQEIKNKPQTFA